MNVKKIRRQNLHKLFEASKLGTWEQFAEACGYNDGNYMRQLSTGHRDIGDRTAEKIEKARNVPPGWMDLPHEAFPVLGVAQEQSAYVTTRPAFVPPVVVSPIVGEITHRDDGSLEEHAYDEGAGEGVVLHATTDAGTFTWKERGDPLRPRVKSGEYLTVDPTLSAEPGHDVVVVLNDGRKMVKELVFLRPDEIEFHSITNGQRVTIPRAEIAAIHRISAIYPRGSAFKI